MNILRRLGTLFRRRRAEADMADEMRFHLEQRAAEYRDDGMTSEEAAYAALRKFGNVNRIQEQARDTFGVGALERLGKDLCHAARQLFRSPGFAVLAIVTLALGIGVNTAMFSILNTLMLRPLPYAASEQLDRFHRATPQNALGRYSPADFLDLRREMAGYGTIVGYALEDTSLADPGRAPEMVRALRMSVDLLANLGLQPQLGRDFRPNEGVVGNDRVVLLSERCWRNRFGAERDLVGRSVRIDGELHEVIGIMPGSINDWRHLGAIDVFRPLALAAAQAEDRTTTSISVIGRRRAGLTNAEAQGMVASFGAGQAATHPEVHANATWRLVNLNKAVQGANGGAILPLLIGLATFVLLIACSNLANLLLARTMARTREFAVRGALGATRLQLLRPLIFEALLLALIGGMCALGVAQLCGDYLSVRSTGDNGERVVFTLDPRVLAWAGGVSLFTALAFVLAPALYALRLDLNESLKSGGRGVAGGRAQQRFHRVLIVGQFAFAMVLLAGAAVFMRGLDELADQRTGWASGQLISGTVVLPSAAYGTDARRLEFLRQAEERLRSLPGVAAVSWSSAMPFYPWNQLRRFVVAGRDRPVRGHEPAAAVNLVSPDYFTTVSTPLRSGRAFTAADHASAPKVCIVNEAMARALFGPGDPMGRRIAVAGEDELEWIEVVGVAANVRSIDAEDRAAPYQVYLPLSQEARAQVELAVRLNGAPSAAMVETLRDAMAALDADLPVRGLQPVDSAIHRANYQIRVLRDILGAMAVLGLALAALGVYGVVARTIAQRMGEFAVRVALGACVRDIVRLVLASGIRLAFVGCVLGLLGALGVVRVLAAGFPAVPLHHPAIIAAAMLFLVGVAVLASWAPARRASHVDPMATLRAE